MDFSAGDANFLVAAMGRRRVRLMMTRDERLQALAEVLMLAADKARSLAVSGAVDGAVSREMELAARLSDIATEFRELAAGRADGAQV